MCKTNVSHLKSVPGKKVVLGNNYLTDEGTWITT